MDYTTFVTTISQLAVDDATNADFVAIIPRAIEYAELRIARDLDLLTTVAATTTTTTSANVPTISFTRGAFVTIQGVNILSPAGQTNPVTATRNPLLPVSKDFLYYTYGSSTNAGLPRYYAMIDDITILLGPWPSAIYTVELVGTTRPTPLASGNPTTFISTYLPDLMTMAAMIYISGWQRNYGRASDDPTQAVSFESQYKTLLQGATVEEARRKFQASGWTSMSPPVAASPTR